MASYLACHKGPPPPPFEVQFLCPCETLIAWSIPILISATKGGPVDWLDVDRLNTLSA
jgi:hypothetical protein